MPFTFSHPTAVVPLNSRGLVFSALVIGSMTPDFDSFLHLSTNVTFAHSFEGVFLFCLPAGLLMFFLFHRVLKFPLLALFPLSHQQRLFPFAHRVHTGSFRHFFRIVLSLFVGSLTHIAWDACTHEYGWIVLRIPALAMPIFQIDQQAVRLYTILQYGGSVFGAVLLVYWYWQWFKRTLPQAINSSVSLSAKIKTCIITCLFSGAGSLAIIYAWVVAVPFTSSEWFSSFLKNIVLSGILILFVELIAFSCIGTVLLSNMNFCLTSIEI